MALTPEELETNVLTIDMRNIGQTGLRRYAGLIFEDILPQLDGQKGLAIYKEMATNDPMCFSMLQAINRLIRKVPWRVKPASQQPFDLEAANFLDTCMHDMQNTWTEFVDEALSMVPYGHSPHEIVYKRRCGKDIDPSRNSKYADGRIAWRYFPLRSQDTIFRWHFDSSGDVVAIEQQAPPNYNYVVIPMEKILLFRTTIFKNNPLGMPILRGAYRPWFLKRGIENIECIAIERELAGLPVAWVPPELLSKNASASQKNLLSQVKEIVTNIRNNEQAGIVFPLVYDENGNKLYDLQLINSGGTRAIDTNIVIQRHNAQIASCALADFLAVGNTAGSQGSKAMHSDKTQLFAASLSGYLDIITETFNRNAIPRLFDLNSFPISDYPQIAHGDVEQRDLSQTADYIFKLAQSGMPMFPNFELEEYLHKIANFPAPPDPKDQDAPPQLPKPGTAPDKIVEVPNDPNKGMAPAKNDGSDAVLQQGGNALPGGFSRSAPWA